MQKPALSLLLLLAGCITIKLEPGYLIVDARVLDEQTQQPTWIALSSYSWTAHLPTQQPIQNINPSRYKIAHIDFQKSRHEGKGTAFSYQPRGQRFTVEAGVIYFVGTIELDDENKNGYTYSVAKAAKHPLLSQACALRPELFRKYPVRFVFGKQPEKDYLIDCAALPTILN